MLSDGRPKRLDRKGRMVKRLKGNLVLHKINITRLITDALCFANFESPFS